MTPEEKSLLERTYKMAEDNNNILRKMRRSGRVATFISVAYWVLIAGFGLATYYYIQPYLMSAVNIINKGQAVINSFPGK